MRWEGKVSVWVGGTRWILCQIFSAKAKQLIWIVAIDFCLKFWLSLIHSGPGFWSGILTMVLSSGTVSRSGVSDGLMGLGGSWCTARASALDHEMLYKLYLTILPSRNWGRNSKSTLSYTAVCRDWRDCMCKVFFTVFKFRGLKIDYAAQSHYHPIRCFL